MMRARHAHIPGEVRLCHLDGASEEYVLTRWQVSLGDEVRAPQVIAVIETESLVVDLEAFDSGVVVELCFSLRDAIPDGAVVARIAPNDGMAF